MKKLKKILGTYKNVGSEVHILKVENEKKKVEKCACILHTMDDFVLAS